MLCKVLGLLFFSVLLTPPSLAQSEDERRQGFRQQQKMNKEFEQEREAGLRDFLKEQSEWEEQRKKDIQADKKRKKQEIASDTSVDYKADRQEKYEDYEIYESTRRAYVKEKKSFEAKNAKEQAQRDAWALEEYGLDKERPRFDIAKRNMYGGKPSGSTNSGGFGGGGPTPSFPAPPVFDDFSDGYVPPPFPPAESFEPPPESFPAPPPIPMPGDPGADFDSGYFPPPPPPMPAPEGEAF